MFDALFTTTTEYKKLSHALSGKVHAPCLGCPHLAAHRCMPRCAASWISRCAS